jgi:hypothetical protein
MAMAHNTKTSDIRASFLRRSRSIRLVAIQKM